MKKLFLSFAIALVATSSFSAQFLDLKRSDIVWAKRYGKTYSGVTQAVATIGVRQKTLLFDGGGTWAITNSVTFPTNISLFVTPDTMLSISTSKILKVSGYVRSGKWQVFTGLGLVTGPCRNAYVYSDWVGPAHTISWLGTPYTSIVTTTILDGRSYASTNWTTNLVTGTSNAIMAAVTNYDASISNGLVSWAVSTFNTNNQTGTTNAFNDISYTDFPYYGAAMTKSGAWSYPAGAVNQHRIVTNWAVTFEYSDAWRSANSRFQAPKAGMWEVSLKLNFGHAVGSITTSLAQVEAFHCMNGATNGNATVTRMLDKAQDNVFSDDSLLVGDTKFYTGATGEFWQIYIRSSVTGALNFAYLDYTYCGKTNLVQ